MLPNSSESLTIFQTQQNTSVLLQNTYMGYLDYRKKTIKDLGISPSTCSFNPGVFVANMTEWKHQRITKQLEKWMQKNVEYVCAGFSAIIVPRWETNGSAHLCIAQVKTTKQQQQQFEVRFS